MGNNDEQKIEDQGGAKEEERKDMVFAIKVDKDGKMSVSAPGDGKMFDEPMCFWMLERGKDHIKMANAQAMKSKIVTPNQGGQPFYRNIMKRKH